MTAVAVASPAVVSASPGSSRFSLAGKLSLLIGVDLLLLAAVAAGAATLGLPPLTIFVVSLAVAVPIAAWLLHRFWSPVRRTLEAVTDGVRSFQEDDFSVRLVPGRRDELGELVNLKTGWRRDEPGAQRDLSA